MKKVWEYTGMAEIQDKCQYQHGYMHTITLFAVEWQSVANKIASEPITCTGMMFTSNLESTIHDWKHISTCQWLILSVMMEDLRVVPTQHELT